MVWPVLLRIPIHSPVDTGSVGVVEDDSILLEAFLIKIEMVFQVRDDNHLEEKSLFRINTLLVVSAVGHCTTSLLKR